MQKRKTSQAARPDFLLAGIILYFFGYMNNPVQVNFAAHFAYEDGLLIKSV